MTTTHRQRWWVVLGMALAMAATAAGEDQTPDVELLEFLGSWGEGDEDWLMATIEEAEAEQAQEGRSDVAEAEDDEH